MAKPLNLYQRMSVLPKEIFRNPPKLTPDQRDELLSRMRAASEKMREPVLKQAYEQGILTPEGEFHLYQHEVPITVPDEATPQNLAFDKDILFIGDVSATMGYLQVRSRERLLSPQKYELQGYDCFCLLATSLVKTAQELGLEGINYGALLLGNHSYFSMWNSDPKKALEFIYSGYRDSCLEVLNLPLFNQVLRQHQEISPNRKILAVMLTDGYIRRNEESAYLPAIDTLIKDGHDFIYVQYDGADFGDLGIHSLKDKEEMRLLAKTLKARGQQVSQIKDYTDLFAIEYDLKLYQR